jgi:hypothetical protein
VRGVGVRIESVINQNALLTQSFRTYRQLTSESYASIAAGVTNDRDQFAAAVAAYGSMDAVLLYARHGAMQTLNTVDLAVRLLSSTRSSKYP